MSAVTEAIYAETPRNGMVGAAQNALGVVNAVLARLSAAAIGIAGCVLTWEVFGRHFWNLPSDWQDELALFPLIGATFLSAAWTQERRGHVAIEALSAILPPRVDRVRRVLIHLAGRPQHLRHQPHRSRYRLGPDPVGHAAFRGADGIRGGYSVSVPRHRALAPQFGLQPLIMAGSGARRVQGRVLALASV